MPKTGNTMQLHQSNLTPEVKNSSFPPFCGSCREKSLIPTNFVLWQGLGSSVGTDFH
jgi:hypothetical protein